MGIISKKWGKKAATFENAKTKAHEIHYSRYIASWYNVGGRCDTLEDLLRFDEWLRSLDLNDADIYNIKELATCGKMELEALAKTFLKEQ